MSQSDQQSPDVPEGAYLVVNAQIFPIRKVVTTIGRKLDNDLVLQDPTISRHHAEIRFAESQFTLVDLGSSSGTFLNNKRITEGVLFPGDIILISNLPVMFMYEGASLHSSSDRPTGDLGITDITEKETGELSNGNRE